MNVFPPLPAVAFPRRHLLGIDCLAAPEITAHFGFVETAGPRLAKVAGLRELRGATADPGSSIDNERFTRPGRRSTTDVS
jgi:hypothetical protein